MRPDPPEPCMLLVKTEGKKFIVKYSDDNDDNEVKRYNKKKIVFRDKIRPVSSVG